MVMMAPTDMAVSWWHHHLLPLPPLRSVELFGSQPGWENDFFI